MKKKNQSLKNSALEIRKKILQMSYEANACHIGSALSCVEILLDIFSKKREQDYFIFSKASGIAAYYAITGQGDLKNYPLGDKKYAIWAGGSLGHGLPVATGLALADRNRDVYILMSDAEMQEGTTWECLLFKKHHRLDNLKIYVDDNGFQACGKIKDILDIGNWGWDFINLFGVNIVRTVKGQGVCFMEGKNEWHYKNLTKPELKKALRKLTN